MEKRRSNRISWKFWVGIRGIDKRPRLREGNISATGIYFESPCGAGDRGEVQSVYLAATDAGLPVEIAGRVTRVVQLDDEDDEKIGTALEFLPRNHQQRQWLRDLVCEIATQLLESSPFNCQRRAPRRRYLTPDPIAAFE